ncbi:2-oxo acid dehydrogenase subunit E2 [Mycobacterium intracellulare]|uniref:2-oxo acid dehydrogenase subunit E2 n=1 Tax=Mycobacterium intracellulare TaxID=1767 RepID=UPI001CDA8B9F|nr:2-oxo acid dehydrogenase subunit E2 [Mycobacterium intracellulare]MCA2256003.1 2-oxo acid dehydrogenase subunit E2 [Mycobacterium intracellulare]
MPQQATGTRVTLPSLGENVNEATITRWLKAPGERIDAGEALLEVATDKVDNEIPSPVTGTIREILVAEGDLVAVDVVLAIVDPTDELSGSLQTAVDMPTAPDPDLPAEPDPDPVEATPKTFASSAPTATPRSGPRVERLSKIRQTIAGRMLKSLHTTAQLTTVIEADVTVIARLRDAHKHEFVRRSGVKLSFLPFFAKAAIEALGEHPLLNSAVNSDSTEITFHGGVNLGIAVDSSKGLLVPVIRDAQHMTLSRLATAIATAANNVRSGQITPDDLTGGTFTITNTGSRGALLDTPILNSPESAILGTGAVVDRVLPHQDNDGATAFGVRSMVYLALTYDHRIIDGADAARFLGAIKHRLHNGFTAEELR